MSTFEKRIATGSDDVEQSASGSMTLNSSDLELVADGSDTQLVGLRFTGIDIPPGAIITSAYIQFQVDEAGSTPTSLVIRGEDVDDAAAFTTARNNVSSRVLTDASVAWSPAAWTTPDQAGPDQRTPDLTALVQEIVARDGWSAGNDLAFVISGTGTRAARAFEKGAERAPLLHIEYTLPSGGTNAAPTLDLDGSAAGTGYATTFTENGAPVAIADADLLIADTDSANLMRATVTLTNAQAGDQLVVNTAGLPAGITVSSTSTATSIVLTGAASPAAYQTALRQIAFSNTSELPAEVNRVINVTVSDGTATSSIAVTTVAIDRAPDAANDTASTVRNTAVTTGNVLANDDPGDGPATVTAFDATSAQGGTVVYNANGTFTYTPATGFTGSDSFTYTIADADGDSASSTVTIAVGSPGSNSAPIDIEFTARSGFNENIAGAVAGTLRAIDPDSGDTHTFTVDDARFEIVGNQLKLKDGVRLDFERNPQVTLNVTATDAGGMSVTRPLTIAVGDVDEIRFAAFGDYGISSATARVAQLVSSLNVDFIVTTGDNIYSTTPIDTQIGQFYSSYIGNYKGAYGTGSSIDRFFPAIGNHEYEDLAGGTNASAYFDYFTLPGNERYYDFRMGPVHFFALNSEPQEPDGNSRTSAQAQWLREALANSDAPFKIVYMHTPAYSSGVHGNSTTRQWPFEEWGATAVLTGHDHIYERILRDDDGDGTLMPYFVTGLGGAGRYELTGTPVQGSAARYSADWGTMLVQASDTTLTFEFISLEGGGTVIDSYTIDLPNADPLLASGDDDLTGDSGNNLLNGLSGNDRLNGLSGNDTLVGGTGDDVFIFAPGSGQDVISDFKPGQGSVDRIDLSAYGFADFAAVLSQASNSGSDVLLNLGNGNTITLKNVQVSQLHQDDFITGGSTTPPPLPTVSIQNASQTEGPGATMQFTVTLSQAAGAGGVIVNYATQDGTALAAAGSAANDFIGVTNGTLTFAQGETSKIITIALSDDAIPEGPETFSVRLTSATNATVSSTSGTATGTILDNDAPSQPPPIQASVVKVTDLLSSAFKSVDETGYGIADPSGLAYVPGLQKLFIADSEHDEAPFFSGTNLFSIAADGTVESYDLSSFSVEPTGLAYNPKNGMLYITDDDARKVFWVDPANPTIKLGEFSTVPFGSDSEDPKFDPVTGNMYMLDGLSRKLFELTAQGSLVRSIDLPSAMSDAEALAYDPTYEVFFVGNGSTSKFWMLDKNGTILNTLDIFANYRNPLSGWKPSIKGLELAPSSDPNDGNRLSLYVADYGDDQQSDGRLLEVSLGAGWLVA